MMILLYSPRDSRNFSSSREEATLAKEENRPSSKEEIGCYKCNKVGHIRPNCPLINNHGKNKKNRRSGKKALCAAAWDEGSASSGNESNGNDEDDLCFMGLADVTQDISVFEVCLKGKPSKDKWFLDSGCSRHMTGDVTKFAFVTMRHQGNVTFGDDTRSKIIGEGTIKVKDIKIIDEIKDIKIIGEGTIKIKDIKIITIKIKDIKQNYR
ncbi:uncharacterized protein LOC143856261 [Tasmannia lanceolata]|uniref:uncharacterized protein LOC143856261 n=1 Tax=Tasmannia lanceolata TaxID=3420 RepID=UPI00406368F0